MLPSDREYGWEAAAAAAMLVKREGFSRPGD